MWITLGTLILVSLSGCGDQFGAEAPDNNAINKRKVNEALARTKIGTTESELREIMKPFILDHGTTYWGGSGARRIFFHLSGNKQVWFEIGGSYAKEHIDKVIEIGAVTPKAEWTRYGGDSILVGRAK